MKILLVSPMLYHSQSGHGTGSFMAGLLHRLGKRHDVTLVAFCNKEELALASTMNDAPFRLITVPRGKGAQKNLFWRLYLVLIRLYAMLRSLLFWQPYYVSKYRHPRMARLITTLTTEERFDIVQIELAQMAQYRKFIVNGKTVLHEHDVAFRPAYRGYKNSHSFFKRFTSFIEWCRWSTYEPRIARTFDHILTVTEQDKLLLQWLTKKSTISYFPRGLTIPESLPAYSKREPFSLLFVGSFSHAPNVDAVRWLVKEILPDVIRRVPQLTCYIIGHNPPAELVQSSLHHTQIKFLGFVKDLSHYLDRSQVFIAPMKTGGGVKVKILEAMAHGIPVVTTKIGAEGIEGISPNNCMIGNSVHQITEQVCTLFHNPMQAEELGRQGYLNTIRYYSLERCVMNIEQTYQSILQHQ